MAHFIGYLEGNRGPVSRLGSAKSGLIAKAQGWSIGGRVTVQTDTDGRDMVVFELTAGSRGHLPSQVVAIYKLDGGQFQKCE